MGKLKLEKVFTQAIVREIKEELNCEIEALQLFNDYTHEYDHVIVNLITVTCKIINGTPTANEHAD